jgi:filamentous hemagglutinin family protein
MKTNAATREKLVAHKITALRRRLLPVLIAGCFGTAVANPLGPQVVNGQVSFNNQGNVLSVTNTPGAIINWQSFSINPGELTRFIQQNPTSAVLNRIVGQDPSQILGALQSNGRVFLINPNGILFGQGAQVDVNGLIASTLNISNEDFLSGKMNFKAGDKTGNLKNQGAITTPSGGQVYLVAPNVENSGIITSPKGEVLLAAGHSVQLVDSMNPDLHVVVSAPENEVLNLGQVIAQGGKTGIYGALVKQRGIVSANSAVVGENGKVVLKASRDTLLEAGSRTTAIGAGKGGEIQVLGERVELAGDASIDASGALGGGTVLVGGDFQGNNPLVRNAGQTVFGKDARIAADATQNGDGGKIIVWSDELTRASGSISAKGGDGGGNGGFVEVSGKQRLAFVARVDTSAKQGKAGTLLLDPQDIIIATGASGADDGLLADNQIAAAEPDTSSNLTISEQALEGLSGNVTLQASRDVILNDLSDSLLNLANVGSGYTFTITAGRHITATADVNDRFQTSGGNVSFTTTNGAINIGGVKSNGGAVGLVAGGALGNMVVREIVTTPSIAGNGGNINLSSNGTSYMTLGGGHIDARGNSGTTGNVVLNAAGPIYLQTGKTIYANHLDMMATGGITDGSTGYLAAQTATLRAKNPGSGNIKISNSGSDLTITDGSFSGSNGIEVGSGNIDITNASGYKIAVHAPIVSNAAPIKLTGPGGIDFVAYVTGTNSGGLVASNNGNIDLLATGVNAQINMPAGAKINSGTGTVTMYADNMAFTGSSILAGTGTVQLAPYNSAVAINLGDGANDDAATLGLTNSELGTVSAGKLRVGTVSSGPIAIKSTLTTGFSTMSLYSGSAITQDPGALLGGATSFNLKGASVTLTEANPTGVISGQATGGDFQYHSANGIHVSAVDDGSGIAVPGANNIYLESDFSGTSAVVQTQAITGGGLAVKTIGGATLNHVGNNVSKIAANLDPGGAGTGSFIFRNASAVAVDSVLAVSGIATHNQEIIVKSDSNTLAVNQPVNAGTGHIVLAGSGLSIANTVSGNNVDLESDTLSLNNTVTASIASIHPYTTGRAITVGSAVCSAAPCLSVTNLSNVVAGTIGIGTEHDETKPAGAIHVAGITTGVHPDSDRNALTTRIGLLTGAGVTQSGIIKVDDLGISAGGTVTLTNVNNEISNLAAATTSDSFTFVNKQALTVTTLSGGTAPHDYSLAGIMTNGGAVSLTTNTAGGITLLSEIDAGAADVTLNALGNIALSSMIATGPTGNVSLTSGTGNISVGADIDAGTGSVTLSATGGAIDGGGIITGGTLTATAASGIGHASPLSTKVSGLNVTNSGSDTAININNTGALTIGTVTQSANVSTGSITINNYGPLTVGTLVHSDNGAINLIAHSPLTVNGTVQTVSGNIVLVAHATGTPGAGDTLTINGSVHASDSGNINLSAGDNIVIPNPANVSTGDGIITKTAHLNGEVVVAPPPTTTPTPPKLSECTANPALSGCTTVLPTVSACTATPTLPGCTVVLPPLSSCVITPTLAGCSAVLPTVAACAVNPTQSGCAAVLPPLSVCITAPTTAGCSAVLPTVAACAVNPTQSGCAAVLPALSVCITAPTTAGCSTVLPPIGSCTANPTLAGCSSVLPTLSQCVATPTLEGCSVVVPITVLPGTPTQTRDAVLDTVNSTVNTIVLATTGSQVATVAASPIKQAAGGGSGSQPNKPAENSDSKDEKKDDKKTTAGPDDSGAKKNESTKKMYCN